jgi:D-methionine transport system permease protein
MLQALINNFTENKDLYLKASLETIQMVSISLVISAVIGFLSGIVIVVTRKGQLFENIIVYKILDAIINIIRSTPFIILLVAIMPVTRIITGTSIGVKGAIVPLVVHTIPYIARLTESSLLEVDSGVVEAYRAMGANRLQIIYHVILKEARPGLILGLTLATINLIGATAMAGVVGAGGIGDLAISYGYQRWEPEFIVGCVLILVIVVQGIQTIGNRTAKLLRKD